MKKILAIFSFALISLSLFVIPAFAAQPADKGFNEFGYNYGARIFNGTGSGWCLARGASANCLGAYSLDKLVMKWNAEWDRGNEEDWLNPPYNAWTDNEWNGKVPGGSDETWHYKIVWVGPCTEGDTVDGGGYCLWGEFAVILSQGTAGGEHLWDVLAKPAGYGAYFAH